MSKFEPLKTMTFLVPADKRKPKEIFEHFGYQYRTPSHGQQKYKQFETEDKYYWEKRVPVDPLSMRCKAQSILEENFVKDFDVMFSKNNDGIHPSIREYFDKPILFEKIKYSYLPKYQKNHDFYVKPEIYETKRSKSMLSHPLKLPKREPQKLTTAMPD